MKEIHTNDELGVVLAYKDFYGQSIQLDNLIDTLQQFTVDDWLCQLARLSILLAGENRRSPKWANAFLQFFTPSNLVDKVNAWFKSRKEKGIVAVVPSERDVGILIELVILHSPTKAPRRMCFPQDLKKVFDAILMVTDLAQPKIEEPSRIEFVSVCASLWLRSSCPDPLTLATHGYHLFEILESNRSTEASEWAILFEQSTGQSLDDYFVGGYTIVAQLLAQSIQDIADGKTLDVLDPIHLGKFPKIKKPMEAYCKLRKNSLSGLKQDICENEVDQNDLGSFNLIAIKKTPLIEYQNTIYPLYLHGVASSLLDGIYHAVISQDQTNRNHRKRVGGVFGNLHEKHVLDVLESGFGNRLLRNPVRKDNDQEAADALLLYERGLVVFQIKGWHTPAKDKFHLRTPKTLQELFDRAGLVYAASQMAKTIVACRQNLVEGIPEYLARPETPIQPVIVTFERIPEFTLIKPKIDSVVKDVKIDRLVRSPVLLCPEDIERIVLLQGRETMWSLLVEYSDSGGSSRSFHNFLNEKNIGSGQLYVERRQQMIERVLGHLES